MKVKNLIARLEEQDPDAIVDVLIAGHSMPIYDVEEGVTTPSNPHGWADITVIEDGRACCERIIHDRD